MLTTDPQQAPEHDTWAGTDGSRHGPTARPRHGFLLQGLRLRQAHPRPHPYSIRFRDALGRQREESGYATQDDAVERLTQLYVEKKTTAPSVAAARRELGQLTVEEYAKQWRPRQRRMTDYSTGEHVDSSINVHIVPRLGARKLNSVTPMVVERFLDERENEGVGRGNQVNISRARTAGNLVYAEQSGLSSAGGFLVTEPLRRLLADHRTELPQALVVGAKGAGKTFMYAKACAARTWQKFAEQSGIRGVTVEAPIVPVLESANLEYGDLEPQDLRDAFASASGHMPQRNVTSSSISDRLKAGLGRLGGQDELGWRSLWLECLAMACGLEVSEQRTSEEALIELGRRAKAVFVIDGLEDLMQNLDSDTKRTALRVLLIDVLGWLRSLRGRPFGLVVFVRRDLVTGAVRQNSGQLLGRYDHYALHWSKEEALRLALWVTAHADALPEPISLSGITDLSADELIDSLIQVWGWKMGSAKSREARSHLWVPAALGDFNGQVQARDVVMFLATAAKNSEQYNDTVDDRVLVPTAMRKALLECSRNKIISVGEENKEIGRLLVHMQGLGHSVLVPFELEQVELTVADADLLIESGVFSKGADGRYWVPEIYRHGLGFNSERRARVLW
ncbi:hypothetical protein ACIGW4_25975 [Streptomyces sp. NPDC053513]|uniref:hypothetical protein n=1 Tax=unclassified Streptomyces TaxID=2593676 RepID=UPI0037CFAFC5